MRPPRDIAMVEAAPPAQPAPNPGPWIFSRSFDLTIFLVPLAAAAVGALYLLVDRSKHMPLWGFLLFIVTFDVAHVWSTIYRTYLDPEERRRRPVLYFLPIPVFLFLAFRLHLHSPVLFWTLLAYVAIFHFIKQNYGFLMMYKRRGGERSPFDFYLDKWTLWVGALGPVLWWHATPKRTFDWFNAGESFILHIDPAFVTDITAIYFGFLGLYVLRQLHLWLRDRHFNPGKQLLMGGHFLTWAVGIRFTDNPLVSAAFLNLFHGIPFLALVWYYTNRKWAAPETDDAPPAPTPPTADAEPGWSERLIRHLARRRLWTLFYLVVLIPALLEALVWDGVVWQQYLPSLVDWDLPNPGAVALSIAVALLSLPQILHYFLDAWIWKFDRVKNPDVGRILKLW